MWKIMLRIVIILLFKSKRKSTWTSMKLVYYFIFFKYILFNMEVLIEAEIPTVHQQNVAPEVPG